MNNESPYSKCPLFTLKNGDKFYNDFLIRKCLRRYYKAMYLPFNMNGISTPIL